TRRGRRRSPFASADHLPDASLWLAHILLSICSARADRWRRLVSHRARFSRRAPKCFPRRAGIHPLRSDGKNFARRSSKAGPLEKCAYQQRSACRNPELFLLWIRRLDFLQLVLYLFGSSARPEPEGQRLLCHASVSRDGGLLHSRRPAERPPYSHPRAAARTLHSRRCRNSVRRRVPSSGSESRKRARGQRCSSRRRRRAVPGPEFLLVRDR